MNNYVILLNSSRINDYQLSTKTALQTKRNVNLDEAPIPEASGGRKSTSQRDYGFLTEKISWSPIQWYMRIIQMLQTLDIIYTRCD